MPLFYPCSTQILLIFYPCHTPDTNSFTLLTHVLTFIYPSYTPVQPLFYPCFTPVLPLSHTAFHYWLMFYPLFRPKLFIKIFKQRPLALFCLSKILNMIEDCTTKCWWHAPQNADKCLALVCMLRMCMVLSFWFGDSYDHIFLDVPPFYRVVFSYFWDFLCCVPIWTYPGLPSFCLSPWIKYQLCQNM